MQPDTRLKIAIVRRRAQLDIVDHRRTRRAVEAGHWVRVAAGSYARRAEWSALTPGERHRTKVIEVITRLAKPAIIAHRAAAACWGIDTLGAWPSRVEVLADRASGGRSGGAIRRYAWGLDEVERVPFGAHEITTPAQTALDLARTLPFMQAVVAVDQALWANRTGGSLATKAAILQLLESSPQRRGDARARRVIEFATHLSGSVQESRSRVLIAQLGFPTPRLQERRVLRSGRLAYGDFYFAEHDHWCELDGRGKYLSPEFTGGRTAEEIVIDEKNRENEIRREVRAFSRWEPGDTDDPRVLYDILTADGLPSSLPRP